MMNRTLMHAKMDTKHVNDMKQKHDTICNHGKHVNKKEKEIGVGRHIRRHTNITPLPHTRGSKYPNQLIITNTNE